MSRHCCGCRVAYPGLPASVTLLPFAQMCVARASGRVTPVRNVIRNGVALTRNCYGWEGLKGSLYNTIFGRLLGYKYSLPVCQNRVLGTTGGTGVVFFETADYIKGLGNAGSQLSKAVSTSA